MLGRPPQFKIVVKFERRDDGGLRAWSPDVPGLVLSNRDPAKVMADLEPAMEAILGERLGCTVRAYRLEKPPLAAARPAAKGPAPVARRRRSLEYAAACA